jgi:hypothetical protein
MIRACDGPVVLHAVLPQQHGASGGVGAQHRNVAAFSSSAGRLVVEGYPISEPHWMVPRAALDASLHPPGLPDKSGGSATNTAQPAGIGRDVLPQNVRLPRAVASPFVARMQCASVGADHIPDTATSRQAPSSSSS